MSDQGTSDELGADVWRGSRWGLLGAVPAARIARASGHPVSSANARNAVNHACTFALAVVAIAILVPTVSRLVAGSDASPSSWVIVCGAIVGLSVNAILHSGRGVRAAERGEISRAPQTIPFVR